MSKQPAIYIVTDQRNGTLYTGVTSNLAKRIYEHKNKTVEGFSSKYNCTILVYYELFEDLENAILREKQIKKWSRKKKLALIESLNPNWIDLYESIT
jgi:putative endonuclease